MSRRLNSNLSNDVRFDLRISLKFQPDRANMKKRNLWLLNWITEREFAVLTP